MTASNHRRHHLRGDDCEGQVDYVDGAADSLRYIAGWSAQPIIRPRAADLTNYARYTVTLNAMLDTAPFLTDTVHIMPTDIFVYLPLVIRGQ